MRNLWLYDGMPDSGKSTIPSLMQRMQMPMLVEGTNHQKIGHQPPIPQLRLVIGHWSGSRPLLIFLSRV